MSFNVTWNPIISAQMALSSVTQVCLTHCVPMDCSMPGGASGKEPAWQCRRLKRWAFISWVGKIPWERKSQPTPVLLLREPHIQRTRSGYNPWGRRVGHNWSDLARNRDAVIQGQSVFYPYSWKLLCIKAQETNKVFENYILAEMRSAWTERDRHQTHKGECLKR